MTRLDHRARALLPTASLLVLGLLASACTDDADDGEGTLRVGLWGQGGSGEVYSLQDAVFRITGPGADLDLFTDDLADGTSGIGTPLAAGDHSIALQPGWHVERGAVGDPSPVVVEATLDTDNPVPFTIVDGLATNVTWVFDVGGELVPMADGTIDIDVDFDEDDGVCTPGTIYDQIFVGTGDYIDQGDGWQSFTAEADGLLYQVGLFWNLSGYQDEYTINVYEGVGTGGALLYSQTYPGLGPVESLYGFDGNGIFPAVELAGGQSYTIEGVSTFGWQTAQGALPGATSSAGNARHKNIQLFAQSCE